VESQPYLWSKDSAFTCHLLYPSATFPHRDASTTVVHCSEPFYPGMTDKSSLCNGLLTRMCVPKERVISNRLYLGEEGHTGMQQTADESALFAPQTGLAFHAWLFLDGVTHRNACTGWVFPIERNTFNSACCPLRYDLRSNNQTCIQVTYPHMLTCLFA